VDWWGLNQQNRSRADKQDYPRMRRKKRMRQFQSNRVNPPGPPESEEKFSPSAGRHFTVLVKIEIQEPPFNYGL
jgi:hypothetical protein